MPQPKVQGWILDQVGGLVPSQVAEGEGGSKCASVTSNWGVCPEFCPTVICSSSWNAQTMVSNFCKMSWRYKKSLYNLASIFAHPGRCDMSGIDHLRIQGACEYGRPNCWGVATLPLMAYVSLLHADYRCQHYNYATCWPTPKCKRNIVIILLLNLMTICWSTVHCKICGANVIIFIS